MTKKESFLLVAEKHAKHLRRTYEKIKSMLPMTAEKIESLSEPEFDTIEVFINRFAKLQDFLGQKFFDMVLNKFGISNASLSLIDKLHLLEKFNVISNAEKWEDLRETRNELTHEYPDHPELIAIALNKAFMQTPFLLECFEKISKTLQ